MFVEKHKMQYKINIIITILSCIYLANIFAYPMAQDNTIFNSMLKLNQNCTQLVDFINKTRYVPDKCNIIFLNSTENQHNNDVLFCYAISDLMYKACELISKGFSFQSSKNIQQEFGKSEKMMDQIFKTTLIETNDCFGIIKHLGNSNDFYFSQLYEKLHEFHSCIHVCTSETGYNPLCMVLFMLNNFIDNATKVNPAALITSKGNESSVTQTINLIGHKSDNKKKVNKTVLNKSKILDDKSVKKDNTQIAPDVQKSISLPKKSEENLDTAKLKNVKSTTITNIKKSKDQSTVVDETSKKIMDESDKIDGNNANIATAVNKENNEMKTDTKETEVKTEKNTIPISNESALIPKQDDEKKTENKIEDKSEENIPIYENQSQLEKNGDQHILDYGDDDDTELHGNDPKKPDQKQIEPYYATEKVDADSSHIFLYFTMMSLGCILLYIMYLSKQKILATFAKLRRSRNRNRRRPSTANYRKLDCTLEEAVTSQCNANVTHVIY